ncbi:MAG: DctP family TRAP transporter solute-binding subunit [Rhodospirillales bacterium]|nr:DctP family TRAP transporter solute-binding subunit [Rhodospirillales bacterium]
MKTLKVLAATTAFAALMAGSAFAADVTMRLGHLNPADPLESHSGTMTTIFKSLVETNSNGAIEVKLFPNGQLGKDNEVIQQVREGIVESCISSSGGVAQHYPVVGVFDLPFAFPNIGVATKVIHKDSSFGKKFVGGLEAKTGLKVLGLIDSGGFFAFTNSKRPIASVADMKGLRIRTMTLPTHETIISSLGGSPTPLPWAEVYTALQTGVADGQMNPVPIIGFAKFDEVQEYLSLTNHVITPYVWMMNKEFLDGLSAEHRALITWAADVATEAGRAMSRVIEASDKGLPRLAAKMKVNAVSPAEIAKFAAASQPAVRKLIEEKLGQEGTDMLNAMLASIKENM